MKEQRVAAKQDAGEGEPLDGITQVPALAQRYLPRLAREAPDGCAGCLDLSSR